MGTLLLFNTSKLTSVLEFGVPEELTAETSKYNPKQASIIILICFSLTTLQ